MAKAESIDLRLERFAAELNLRQEGNKRMIQCGIRRTWLVLQPEEFVRQLLLLFLLSDMKYNRNRITVERGLSVHQGKKRTDILVFDPDMRPFLLIECKAHSVPLTNAVFRQAGIYNSVLKVPYVMVSNGRQSYVARINYEREDFMLLPHPPEYPR